MKRLMERWGLMSMRERLLLATGGGMLLAWLCYALLWQPLQQQRERWQRAIAREQGTVEWMLEQAPQLRHAQGRADRPGTLSPTAAATQGAAELGVKVIRLQPQGDRLLVVLEPLDFNRLMLWIERVERQSGARVVTLGVTRQPDAGGRVRVNQLILERNDEH
ncbi:type II secretion system protein GspM [Zobellella sp. DQSA1]|uniref:type II secretion system protein GspM n=1 Tax=Zobellella sp. DQSA1 TaxID=3342386 RepID=UPI0035C00314